MSGRRRKIVVGTRGSALAMFQAETVCSMMDVEVEIKKIVTAGDRIKGQLRTTSRDFGFFTKEIENRLVSREIDIAVHSLKDLPTMQPEGLEIVAVIERDYPADVIVFSSERFADVEGLMETGTVKIATSSLRRRALCKRFFPRASVVPMRGNVDTRLEKLRSGICEAMVLSRAGIERLKPQLDGLRIYELNPQMWLPSAGQGVIAIEARADDNYVKELCLKLNHRDTRICTEIERRLMKLTGGGCHAPFGAYAKRLFEGDEIQVFAGWTGRYEGGSWRSVEIAGKEDGVVDSAYKLLEKAEAEDGTFDIYALFKLLV